MNAETAALIAAIALPCISAIQTGIVGWGVWAMVGINRQRGIEHDQKHKQQMAALTVQTDALQELIRQGQDQSRVMQAQTDALQAMARKLDGGAA